MEGVQSFHWMAGTAKTTVPSGATFIPFWQQHLYSDSLLQSAPKPQVAQAVGNVI